MKKALRKATHPAIVTPLEGAGSAAVSVVHPYRPHIGTVVPAARPTGKIVPSLPKPMAKRAAPLSPVQQSQYKKLRFVPPEYQAELRNWVKDSSPMYRTPLRGTIAPVQQQSGTFNTSSAIGRTPPVDMMHRESAYTKVRKAQGVKPMARKKKDHAPMMDGGGMSESERMDIMFGDSMKKGMSKGDLAGMSGPRFGPGAGGPARGPGKGSMGMNAMAKPNPTKKLPDPSRGHEPGGFTGGKYTGGRKPIGINDGNRMPGYGSSDVKPKPGKGGGLSEVGGSGWRELNNLAPSDVKPKPMPGGGFDRPNPGPTGGFKPPVSPKPVVRPVGNKGGFTRMAKGASCPNCGSKMTKGMCKCMGKGMMSKTSVYPAPPKGTGGGIKTSGGGKVPTPTTIPMGGGKLPTNNPKDMVGVAPSGKTPAYKPMTAKMAKADGQGAYINGKPAPQGHSLTKSANCPSCGSKLKKGMMCKCGGY